MFSIFRLSGTPSVASLGFIRRFAADAAPPNFKYLLGVELRDRITGMKGVVIGRIQHITGCNKFLLDRGLDSKGDPRDSYAVDEMRLEPVENGQDFTSLAASSRKETRPGGPNEKVALFATSIE